MQRLAAIVDNEDALKMRKERLNEEEALKMEKFGVKGWCRSWNGKGVSGYVFGILGYAEHREKLYLSIRSSSLHRCSLLAIVGRDEEVHQGPEDVDCVEAVREEGDDAAVVKELSTLWTYVKVVEFGEVAWR
ncbi:uncharacterized protein HKW66_Vig0202820 [Vigna angularis]|uniref:Uncharacterized protein n=1 Tax=Phaseolus angularis TaxID=3914 RepID=A0A8T0JVL2_PHAAN|nr:uncharacterized protein HKW66_Vig0202820 [Vigna angularis]